MEGGGEEEKSATQSALRKSTEVTVTSSTYFD
jgi:hypothetical protein